MKPPEKPPDTVYKRISTSIMVKFIFLMLLWFIAFTPVYPEMVDTWFNSDYNSHGFLVPFISLYFIYYKKDTIRSIPIGSSGCGVIIIFISMVFYLIGYAGDIAIIMRLMLVLSLMGVINVSFGKQMLRQLLFPLFFILFMIPVPLTMIAVSSLPLQLASSAISADIINMLTIPVYQEGNILYLAKTQLEIAEACSGIKFIISFIMLGVVFVFFLERRYTKMVIMLSTIPLAIFVNIIRIAGTGILSHHVGVEVAQGFFHEFSGIVIFVLGFVLLISEFSILRKIELYFAVNNHKN